MNTYNIKNKTDLYKFIMTMWTLTQHVVVLSAMSFAAACGGATAGQDGQHAEGTLSNESDGTHAASAHGGAPHWGYKGEIGPDHWGTLSPEYSLCGQGAAQSPVDVVTADTLVDEGHPNLIMQCHSDVPLNIVNNGHSIQVNSESECTLGIGEETYTLLQLHFHTPSENTVDGTLAAGEMHLVHKSGDTLAVVGVLFNVGDANPTFQTILDNADTSPGEARQITDVAIDINTLLPSERAFYFFNGSLTTPPCTEGVLWYLMQTPITVSQSQIDRFKSIIGANNRPTQPLNGRIVKRNP